MNSSMLKSVFAHVDTQLDAPTPIGSTKGALGGYEYSFEYSLEYKASTLAEGVFVRELRWPLGYRAPHSRVLPRACELSLLFVQRSPLLQRALYTHSVSIAS